MLLHICGCVYKLVQARLKLKFLRNALTWKCILLQGFIQALLLTFIFHEELSFMAVGHNLTCVSMLAIAIGGSEGALQLGSGGNASESFDYFTNSRFSNNLSMHHWVTFLFPFLGLFLLGKDLHGDFVSLPPCTKWQHRIASHVNISWIFF